MLVLVLGLGLGSGLGFRVKVRVWVWVWVVCPKYMSDIDSKKKTDYTGILLI